MAEQKGQAEQAFEQGIALGALDGYEEAVKAFEEAIRLKPDYGAGMRWSEGLAMGRLRWDDEAFKGFAVVARGKLDLAALDLQVAGA